MKESKTYNEDILRQNRKLKNELDKLSDECKRLKENNKKYKEFFGKIPLAYQSLDENGSLIEVNPTWLKTLGYTSGEVIGKNFGEFLHPDSKSQFRQRFPRFKQQGSIYDVSFKMRHKDGRYLELLIDGMISYNPDGSFRRTHCICRDMTKNFSIAKKLKESEETYRSIYNKTPVMLHSINREGKLISVSDYWLEIMGYKREEVIGKPSIDFLTEESRKAARQKHLPDFFKSGYARDVPYRYVKKNGDYMDVSMSAVGIRNSEGEIVKSLAVLIDITARKRTEEALRQSERRYLNLINTLPYGILEADPYGKILFLNDAFCKIVGYEKEELIETNIWDHGTPVEEAKRIKNYFDCIRKERPEPGPFISQNVRKDGKVIDVHFDWNYRFDQNGYLKGFIGILTDVTKQMKAEKESINKSEQLHSLASHLQMVREEERKNMAREIHDEFGQVLSALKMNLANIERELGKEKMKGNIKPILNEIDDSKRMTGYAINAVKRLMTELRPEILDISGLIPAVQWLVEDLSGRYAIDAEFDCNVEAVNLGRKGNTAVFRLVQEALNNVIKHARASKAMVKINKEESYLRLEIEDNGKGFDKSEMNKINSFGLIGMQERVLVLKGTMEIESKYELGTRLKFRIPIDN